MEYSDLQLSQFGFLNAAKDSNIQLLHIDDESAAAVITIFLLSDIEVDPADPSRISASSAPATRFVDLSKYNGLDFKKVFGSSGEKEVLKLDTVKVTKKDLMKLNNVNIWGTCAEIVDTTISDRDFCQFIATIIHAGPGSGKDSSIDRFIVFFVFTPRDICSTYQKVEYQILAPEMLLLYHQKELDDRAKLGQPQTEQPTQGEQLLKCWVDAVGKRGVMFNYQKEVGNFTRDTALGIKIRNLIDDNSD